MAANLKNADIVKGNELWMFIGAYDDTKGLDQQTANPVAFATSHSLNRSVNTNSVSSKDHGNAAYVTLGEGSWTTSTENLYSVDSFDTLNDLFQAGQKVYVQFGKLGNYTQQGDVENGNGPWTMGNSYMFGAGYMTSLQASGGTGDSATFSAEVTGLGSLYHAYYENNQWKYNPPLAYSYA